MLLGGSEIKMYCDINEFYFIIERFNIYKQIKSSCPNLFGFIAAFKAAFRMVEGQCLNIIELHPDMSTITLNVACCNVAMLH